MAVSKSFSLSLHFNSTVHPNQNRPARRSLHRYEQITGDPAESKLSAASVANLFGWLMILFVDV